MVTSSIDRLAATAPDLVTILVTFDYFILALRLNLDNFLFLQEMTVVPAVTDRVEEITSELIHFINYLFFFEKGIVLKSKIFVR